MKSAFETICEDAHTLGLALSPEELAHMVEGKGFGERELGAIGDMLGYLCEKKHERRVAMRLSMSRLPLKSPKTFSNFDFGRLQGPNHASLEQLPALANLHASRNLAFIGPEGVGKTHLAQAYAHACCELGLQSYYIKARELRDKFAKAVKMGNEPTLINTLVRPNCLVVDEIGRCVFDKASTELFFHIVDKRLDKRDCNIIIVTSNYGPDKWDAYFSESSTLLCMLDRIFDNASVYMMDGSSYRGSNCERLVVKTAPIANRI